LINKSDGFTRQNMGVTSKNNEINQQTCFFLSIHQFESIKKGSLLQGGSEKWA
jgi:hypothetical protein